MDIHRSLVKDFILPQVNSVYVVDYYLTIQNIFAGREDFHYECVLANPRIRTHNEIVWATESFQTKPALLSSLDIKDRLFYADILARAIGAMKEIADTLKEETDNLLLSELLTRALSYIDEGSVYCADKKIVIVNWGIMPRKTGVLNNVVYKNGVFMGILTGKEDCHKQIAHSSHHSIEPQPSLDVQETVSDETDFCSRLEPNDNSTIIDDDNIATMDIIRESTIVEQTLEPDDAAPLTNDAGQTLSSDEEHIVAASEGDNGQNDRKKKGGRIFISIFLLLTLLIGTLFLCRECQSPINIANPFYNPLPSVPVAKPIADGTVCESPDGMSMIASDRLNIYIDLKGDSRNMLRWARAFKREYPGKEYSISYYDYDLELIQILVPSTEREIIKSTLKGKLSEFSFEVFYESIYVENKKIKDPALSDPNASWYLNQIDMPEAWSITRGSKDVVVAVVDNGFDSTHPEFEGRILETYNVLTRKSKVNPVLIDNMISSHGTQVAGIVAGNTNNGQGLCGIAPKCRLMLVQVGDDSQTGSIGSTALIDGVKYSIKHGADVVNVSIGQIASIFEKSLSEGDQLNYISNSYKAEEEIWRKLFKMAEARKCVMVLSAGNDGVISGIDPKRRFKGTIIVSALDRNLCKASFSNYGVYPHLDRDYSTVSAPGVDIYNAFVCEKYGYNEGTSFSAPIVSGAVALMKSVDRNLTAYQIIDILRKTGTQVATNIGPMINVGHALQYLKGDSRYERDCKKIASQIKELQRQVDSLLRLCPESGEPEDTLKYNTAINDHKVFTGRWKATTKLVSRLDQSPVDLYMEFHDYDGIVEIVNKNEKHTAPLKLEIEGQHIYINQLSDALSESGSSFAANDFECSGDRNGNLLCSGITASGAKIGFNLVRVKN
jgi:subtilisin family serine protease